MRLMSIREMRLHVVTDLEEQALQNLMDACEADLTRWAGPLDLDGSVVPVTETIRAPGLRLLPLHQYPESITTVTDTHGSTDLDLVEATDWNLVDRTLERVTGYWGRYTVVTYVPMDDRALRRRALVKLVQLELNHQPGLGQQQAGAWLESYFGKSYEDEKLVILSTVRPRLAFA